MAEEEMVFESNVKNSGIISFKDFYKFCYDWLSEEGNLDVAEEKYVEKISGSSKNIDIEWTGTKKITDYFKFKIKVTFEIKDLIDVEVNQDGVKVKTNKGAVKVKVKGILIRDYDGKFEKDAFRKFLRGIYEKYIIHSRIEQFEDKLIGKCNEFLEQVKAYMDLTGRK